jgi:hypothetical protein
MWEFKMLIGQVHVSSTLDVWSYVQEKESLQSFKDHPANEVYGNINYFFSELLTLEITLLVTC